MKDGLTKMQQEMIQTYQKSCDNYKKLRVKLIKIRKRLHQEIKSGNTEQAEAYDSVAGQYVLVCRTCLDEIKLMRENLATLLKAG